LCAGLLVEELIRMNDALPLREGLAFNRPAQINDFGIAMLHAYRSVQDRLQEALLASSNGKRLSKIGFHEDVVYCSQTNRFDLAPQVVQGKIACETPSAPQA